MATHEAGDVCGSSQRPKLEGQKHLTTHGRGYEESREREEQAQTRATQQPQESSGNWNPLNVGGRQRSEGQGRPRVNAPRCANRQEQSCSERTTVEELGKVTLTPQYSQKALREGRGLTPFVVCASLTRSCCCIGSRDLPAHGRSVHAPWPLRALFVLPS